VSAAPGAMLTRRMLSPRAGQLRIAPPSGHHLHVPTTLRRRGEGARHPKPPLHHDPSEVAGTVMLMSTDEHRSEQPARRSTDTSDPPFRSLHQSRRSSHPRADRAKRAVMPAR
jgi:hypothetical protein